MISFLGVAQIGVCNTRIMFSFDSLYNCHVNMISVKSERHMWLEQKCKIFFYNVVLVFMYQ